MTRRFGHRATLLILFGLVWLAFAFGVLSEPSGPPMLHTSIPVPIRFAMWSGTGAVAIYCGLRRSRHDWLGWAALYIMPAVRAMSYLIAWLDSLLPDLGDVGLPRGWLFAAIWLLLVLIIMVCAGWPEPVTPTREDPEEP